MTFSQEQWVHRFQVPLMLIGSRVGSAAFSGPFQSDVASPPLVPPGTISAPRASGMVLIQMLVTSVRLLGAHNLREPALDLLLAHITA